MVFLAPLILVLLVGSTWLYLRHSPSKAGTFNKISLVVIVLVEVGVYVWAYLFLKGTNDSAWWPVIGTIYAGLLWPLMIGLAAVIRRRLHRP